MNSPPCIIWDVSPVFLTLGPISVRWYGLFFFLSFLSGYLLLYWQFKRAGRIKVTADLLILNRLVLYLFAGIILGGYLGCRLFFLWETMTTSPWTAFSFQGGIRGMSSHGAALGILGALFLFHLRSRIRFTELLDRLSFSAAVGAIFVRLGNLMNSECVGRQSTVFWAFCFPRHDRVLIPRHPAQIYEIVIGITVLLALLAVDRKCGDEKRPLGLMAGVFLAGYFGLRFLVEFLKEGNAAVPGLPFNLCQILSLPFALLGVYLIAWSLRTKLPASLNTSHEETPHSC